ncbi:MAG: helix-turn-helix domain-containing protein [Bdellovibrionota bacterium]
MPNFRRSQENIKKEAGPIAVFVREQRKYLDYTQEEFAKRVGVNSRFLKELELGKPTLRMDKVNQVLQYLGARLEPVKYKDED